MSSQSISGSVEASTTGERWAAYGLLWCLGLYLRLSILIVPPLIPQLKDMLGFSNGEVAIATSLPLVTLSCGALIAGWLLARLGARTAMLLGLAIMAIGSSLRALPEGFLPFLLATVVMGVGIAFMQTAISVLAKLWVPGRVGRASAIYANALLVGELLAAGVTGPLFVAWLNDAWQWAFALWVLPVPLLILALVATQRILPASSSEPVSHNPGGLVLPDWRDARMWRLATLLGCAASLYFCGNVFLPPILEASERLKLLDPSLAALNATQMVSSALLIVWADRLLGKRWPLIVIILCALISIPAMLQSPGTSIVWTAGVFGFFTSALFILVLALPAWLANVEQLPKLMSGVLFFGYLLVFLITVIGGWLNDISGYVVLAFLPTLLISLAAMVGTKHLLAS